MLKDQAEEFESHDDSYADEIEEAGWPTMRDMLAQIIGGKLNVNEGSEFGYGYAMKILCAQVGRFVQTEWEVSDVRRVPFNTAMMLNGPPLPIPKSDDFPEVGHLSVEDVKAELAAIASVAEPEVEYEAWDIKGFHQALQEAAKAGLGLVSFRH
jgi:hypothetical protein